MWFSSLSGDMKAGAEYWAGQRSLLHPGKCTGTPDFSKGCNKAKARLTDSDALRKFEPDYKDGWNSYEQPATPPAPPAAPPPSAGVAASPAPAAAEPSKPATVILTPDQIKAMIAEAVAKQRAADTIAEAVAKQRAADTAASKLVPVAAPPKPEPPQPAPVAAEPPKPEPSQPAPVAAESPQPAPAAPPPKARVTALPAPEPPKPAPVAATPAPSPPAPVNALDASEQQEAQRQLAAVRAAVRNLVTNMDPRWSTSGGSVLVVLML